MNTETEDQDLDQDEKKWLNLSFSTRHADITIDNELYEQHDMYLPKLRKISRIAMFTATILAAIGTWLLVDGKWIFSLVVLMIAGLAFLISHATLSAGSTSAYQAGLLIPAVVSSTNPIQIVALANIANSDDEEDTELQWACKRVELTSLPLHKMEIGERVPCVALFGGSRNGMYVAFEPRPLTWVTSSIEEIKNNENRIDPEEWAFLSKIYTDLPQHKADQIALFDTKGVFEKTI